MLKVLYEDERYKAMYGSAKKGCSAIERKPSLIIIDKQKGYPIELCLLPGRIIEQVINEMEAYKNGK